MRLFARFVSGLQWELGPPATNNYRLKLRFISAQSCKRFQSDVFSPKKIKMNSAIKHKKRDSSTMFRFNEAQQCYYFDECE